MIQTPTISLPSAARGCWLVWFCRAALWYVKEFPNLCSLEGIKPMAGDSEGGSDKAKTPLPPSPMAIDVSAPAAPGRAQRGRRWGEDALRGRSCLCLCHGRAGGRSCAGLRPQDTVGKVLRLIPGLVLTRGPAALLDLVHLPHPSGFSHLLLFAFLIFSPIFNPMPNSFPSS